MIDVRRLFASAVVFVGIALSLMGDAAPVSAQDVSIPDVEREANAGRFDQAYSLLVQLAESGNAQAQGFLGYVLYEGEWGVPIDEVSAKKWMQAAYEHNDAYAHLFVGLTNSPDNAEQLAKDPSLIVSHDWETNIRIAAENGHPYAQNMMGHWAKNEYKYEEAIDWYRKASMPNRDYFAVNYLVTKSLYQWPRRVRVEAIEARAASGNPFAFEALHAAYALGLQAKVDYEKAYKYGILGSFYDAQLSSEASKRIEEGIPNSERMFLRKTALQLLDTWAHDPGTLVGAASSWCFESGRDHDNCKKHAVEDHLFCKVDYILWNFDNFIDFPAYKECRESFYESTSPETN